MAFKRLPSYDYKPIRQADTSTPAKRSAATEEAARPSRATLSRAEQRIVEHDKTIEFYDWLRSLVDERLKDVTVRINPDDEPEVWMAMQRIFKATAQENLNFRSYAQVLDALRDVKQLELEEAQIELNGDEDELIAQFEDAGETEELTPTPEMDLIDEDETAIQEALEGRTITFQSVAGQSVPKPKPKPKPRPHYYWWRRYWWRGRLIRWRWGRRFDFRRRRDVKAWLDWVRKERARRK